MAFDMGFNFRETLAYVTDQSFCVFAAWLDTYPKTYTNGNGYSINAGWVSYMDFESNRASGNDPRIAGVAYLHINAGASKNFRIDLSSGSAPGATTYDIDTAWGDATAGDTQFFAIKDNTTTLIDGTNGGSGYTTATGHYIDATLADVAATTTWTGTKASKTFASAICNIIINPTTVSIDRYVRLAHFRLALPTVTARVHDFFPFFVPGLLSTPS
jgi:hypothetical protein